jgi:hypothetical protein
MKLVLARSVHVSSYGLAVAAVQQLIAANLGLAYKVAASFFRRARAVGERHAADDAGVGGAAHDLFSRHCLTGIPRHVTHLPPPVLRLIGGGRRRGGL